MKFVDIESRHADVIMRITPVRHPWDENAHAWDVQVTAPELDSSAVALEDPASEQTLDAFFRELAGNHRGWDGDKHWQSAGGLLKIRSDHDQINTTHLYVTLTGGRKPQWTIQAELHVDPLRFDQVATVLELYAGDVRSSEPEEGAEPVRIDPRQRAREGLRRIGSMNVKYHSR